MHLTKYFPEYLVASQGVASSQVSAPHHFLEINTKRVAQFVQSIQTGTEPFTGTATLNIATYSVAINH